MERKCKVCGLPADIRYAEPYCRDCFEEMLIQSKEKDEIVFSAETKGNEVVILKDSGARTEFESGAVRDIQVGKGRCDLLPLDVVGALLNFPELTAIEEFKETKDVFKLYKAIRLFAEIENIDLFTLIIEVSKHFESGAIKYGENNWKKGMGLHYYLSSAVRHFLEHKRGDTDEPHNRAFVWNLLCAAWTKIHKPELDDINIDMAPLPEYCRKSPNEIRAAYGLDPINNMPESNFLQKEFHIPKE